MVLARPTPRRPSRKLPESLTGPALWTRPSSLVGDDLLPVVPPLAELLGTSGLRRGGTIVVHGGDVPGATSLLLGLLAGPSAQGAWCAVVGAPELGLVAADELGVALEHLVLVPEPGRRLLPVVGALLDGCDVVCLRLPSSLMASDARRLAARAREHRAVLVVATGGAASLVVPSGASARPGTPGSRGAPGRPGSARTRLADPNGSAGSRWPEMPDVRLAVLASRFTGAGRGSGKIEAHLLEVVARRRRAAPEELARWLWLPGPDGRVALAADVPAVSAGATDLRATGATDLRATGATDLRATGAT